MNKAKTLIHHHIEHYIRQEKLIRRFKDQEGRNNSYNWHGPQHGPNRDWGDWECHLSFVHGYLQGSPPPSEPDLHIAS
jgi:hypothetical protein